MKFRMLITTFVLFSSQVYSQQKTVLANKLYWEYLPCLSKSLGELFNSYRSVCKKQAFTKFNYSNPLFGSERIHFEFHCFDRGDSLNGVYYISEGKLNLRDEKREFRELLTPFIVYEHAINDGAKLLTDLWVRDPADLPAVSGLYDDDSGMPVKNKYGVKVLFPTDQYRWCLQQSLRD